jgi:hypothetical protein
MSLLVSIVFVTLTASSSTSGVLSGSVVSEGSSFLFFSTYFSNAVISLGNHPA